MKALSLHQPYAELILQGRKTIETRTWRTAHRGLFAIHAAWHVDGEIAKLYGIYPESLVSGALIGTAEIVEMIEFDDASWDALLDQHLVPDLHPNSHVGWRQSSAVSGIYPSAGPTWIISPRRRHHREDAL
jgi:hypothetical protein